MGKMSMYWLECAILNAYCPIETFWENVGNDREEVIQRVKECTTEQAVIQIMNEYI